MIPAAHGTWLQDEHGRLIDEVIAWNEEGWPMREGRGGLVAVNPAHVRLVSDPDPKDVYRFTSFTPTEGWRALFRERDGSLFDQDVVGWGVGTNGVIVPVGEYEGEGFVSLSGSGNYIGTFRDSELPRAYALHEPKTKGTVDGEPRGTGSDQSTD